ncbi:hypothetical protein M2390_002593 [Mycetocola sp. BIGb0189]|uniref:hypothetical protein n=1 Tax=Mycetocola sp. BIGb0189 TaxID=2940604 RepID=UPI002169E7F5|nr:hypothetical protein [Mycetocola sp. BIGb0189]MCS4277387.1 hypothetical protein [Mycetocola sp. BIGb0189]
MPDPLALPVAGGWVVKYPWERLPLSMNDRLHPMAKAKKTAAVRKAAAVAFAGVPAQERVRVEMIWWVNTRHRRDAENCVATLKPWCDGLVDAGLVPDDTPEWMVKIMPEIRYAREVEAHVEFRVTYCVNRVS